MSYTFRFQISCLSVVTIMFMLMHEGCCTIECITTTALVMAVLLPFSLQVCVYINDTLSWSVNEYDFKIVKKLHNCNLCSKDTVHH